MTDGDACNVVIVRRQWPRLQQTDVNIATCH